MTSIQPITTTVFGNEKAYSYMEINQPSSVPGKGMRRYRIILVNRDGKMSEYREDMGSAKKFKGVKQLNIPSLWEHSVDELRGLADELRYDTQLDLPELLQNDKYKLG